MKIFLDTSGLIAYLLLQDTFHEAALKKYNLYRKRRATLVTSNYILDELMTWFSANVNEYYTKKLLSELERMQKENEVKIVFVDETMHESAIKIFSKFLEHEISFTDATTYVIYKELKVDEIFTLDSDFKKMRLQTSNII